MDDPDRPDPAPGQVWRYIHAGWEAEIAGFRSELFGRPDEMPVRFTNGGAWYLDMRDFEFVRGPH